MRWLFTKYQVPGLQKLCRNRAAIVLRADIKRGVLSHVESFNQKPRSISDTSCTFAIVLNRSDPGTWKGYNTGSGKVKHLGRALKGTPGRLLTLSLIPWVLLQMQIRPCWHNGSGSPRPIYQKIRYFMWYLRGLERGGHRNHCVKYNVHQQFSVLVVATHLPVPAAEGYALHVIYLSTNTFFDRIFTIHPDLHSLLCCAFCVVDQSV